MDSLLVITSYPTKGDIHSKLTVGGAAFAKSNLLGIKQNYQDLKITVLAEELEGEKNYTADGIEVRRVWNRGSIQSFVKLFQEARRHIGKNILIEFEVSMFGNPIITSPLPFYIMLMRIMGKNVTIVMHQAITDLSNFEGHTNIKGIKSKLLNIGIKAFYKLLILSTNKIIVFENALKELLSSSEKINVVPLGVQNFKDIGEKNEARERLNIPIEKKVFLVFGYIAWYKGTDWIVEEFKKLQKTEKYKDYLLIIGGGPNPNHKDKAFYNEYVEKITSTQNENIICTGFVEESQIKDYYACSDLVILPYRVFMSSSGPLSLAYSFKKPSAVSAKLKSIYKTFDIENVIEKLDLTEKDLSFDLDSNSLLRILESVENKTKMEKLTQVSSEMRKLRDFKEIGKQYYKVISK